MSLCTYLYGYDFSNEKVPPFPSILEKQEEEEEEKTTKRQKDPGNGENSLYKSGITTETSNFIFSLATKTMSQIGK